MSNLRIQTPLVTDAHVERPARRPVVIIQPTRGWAALNLRELWQYRDLLLILAGRDVKLRYPEVKAS